MDPLIHKNRSLDKHLAYLFLDRACYHHTAYFHCCNFDPHFRSNLLSLMNNISQRVVLLNELWAMGIMEP